MLLKSDEQSAAFEGAMRGSDVDTRLKQHRSHFTDTPTSSALTSRSLRGGSRGFGTETSANLPVPQLGLLLYISGRCWG
jgi:hypothetical protein